MAFGGFRFAGLELKNILGGAGMKALLVALAVIPCLCAAFYLASYSDPYKALERVPVAVVNLDEGATINDEERNVGQEVCDDIAARSDGLQWNFVSAEEAQAGMEAGTYYMTCTIPADFSEKIASADSGDPKSASMSVEYNESQNVTASQAGRSVWQQIQGEVTDSVTRQYWNAVLTRTSDAGQSMEESATGAQQLAEGMDTVVEGNAGITEGIAGIGQGAAALQSGLGAIASGGDALAQGAAALSSTGGLLGQGASALAVGTQALAGQTSALGEQTQQLADGAQAIDQGLGAAVQSIGSSDDDLSAENPTLAASSQAVTDGLAQLSDGLALIQDGAVAPLKQGLSAVKGSIDGVAGDLHTLADDAAASEDGQQSASSIQEATEAASAVSQHVSDAQEGVGSADESVSSVQGDVAAAASALKELSAAGTLSAQDQAAVDDVLARLASADESLTSADASLGAASSSLGSAAENAQSTSAAIAGISNSSAAGISAQIEAAAQALDAVSASAIGAKDDTVSLGDLGAADAEGDSSSGPDSAKVTLFAAINGIDSGLDSTQAAIGDADTPGASLAFASNGVTQGIDALGEGLSLTQQGTSALSLGTTALAAATPLLSEGITQLDQGAQGVATGLEAYIGGVDVLAQSVPAFVQGLSGVAEGTGALVSGSNMLAQASGQMGEGLSMVGDGVSSIADQLTEDSDGLHMPQAEIDDKAQMMSTPVELDEGYYTHVDSFAAGIAPYFWAVCLWVGCLIASFVLRPFDRRLVASGANPFAAAFSGFAPMALLAAAQSLVLMVVLQFVFGMQVQGAAQFYAFGLLAAVAFAAIMQLLSAAFGLGGRLAAVVLLMLQIACASGVFPVETAGGLFQALGHIMPMAYAIDGMRQIMCGVGFNVAAQAAVALAVVAIVVFALTALAAYRRRMVRMADLHPAMQLG